jgi:transcriptional regulator with GAF, ATPase, and Fis domain
LKLATDRERLRALLEVSRTLHQMFDTDQLLKSVIERTKDLVDAETVSAILHDPATDELYFRSEVGNPEKDARRLKELRFPASQGIAGRVLRSGQPELIRDVAVDPSHFKKIDSLTGFTTRSMIAAPLHARGRITGVLEACHRHVGAFTKTDLNFLSTIAGTVGTALDNARMYEELQDSYLKLQRVDRDKDLLIGDFQQENYRRRRELEARYQFDGIKGNSPQMIEVFKLCEKAIHSDIAVLILGETGTGKELIARCIHLNGSRSEYPFVSQNCGGIHENLLASELFGHRRGAFTGAIADKKGLFEEADGGTIFLDEVGDMPLSMQVSLLRVLQDGELRSLGANHCKRVNVRVISATNRNLAEDVREGRFREDLYYRLKVFPIQLPALRERTGDIPILVRHFVRKYAEKSKKSVRGISQPVMHCLQSFPFPGNIRQLENEIERAIAMVEEDGTIELEHLSGDLRANLVCAQAIKPVRGTLKEMVEALEVDVLRNTMQKHAGNKTSAAKELGLSRFGLMKKLQRYNL